MLETFAAISKNDEEILKIQNMDQLKTELRLFVIALRQVSGLSGGAPSE